MTEALYARVVALIGKDGLPVTTSEGAGTDIVEVVISAGSEHGVVEDMRFILYEEGEELFDPVTNESLGLFEIVKGKGRATHVQARQSRIRSTQTRRVERDVFAVKIISQSSGPDYKLVAVPFKGVKVGDIVRPI